ncbi:MAG: hypothetical protein ACM3PR_15205 [Bacteroidales bacterium]
MSSSEEQFNLLLKAMLPEEIFQYFEITRVLVNETSIDVHVDELNLPPSRYKDFKLVSKGFTPTVIIQDFPIRERAVFLHVRRRKWQVESTGEIVSQTWDTTAQGTRYTKGFAAFLKEIFGHLPPQQQKP